MRIMKNNGNDGIISCFHDTFSQLTSQELDDRQ